MSIERFTFIAADRHRGLRLDIFLAQELPGLLRQDVSRRKVRRWIADGAVYLDRQRVRIASKSLRSGAQVEIYLDRELLDAARPAPIRLDRRSIVYEDEHLIAIDKPAGLPSQATVDDAVNHVYAEVERLLRERDGRVGYLALHHRLDRGTSGVMILARSRAAGVGMASAFARRRVRKVYQALVEPIDGRGIAEAFTVHNRLARQRDASGRLRMVAVTSGGVEAETEFRILRRFASPQARSGRPPLAWLEALPRTGRTHQVRIHLSDVGLPILGDPLYGPPPRSRIEVPRLMLHAASLSLEHPVTSKPLCLVSPLPDDFLAMAGRGGTLTIR